MQFPETRYAKSGDVHIAYQVFGQGRVDLVFVGIEFEERGPHQLKGVPGDWRLFAVVNA